MIFYTFSVLYVHVIIHWFRKLPLSFLILATSPIVVFASLRGNSGKDTYQYLYRFYNFDVDSIYSNEPILNILISISKLFSESHISFFFLHALLVCILFCLALKKFDSLRLYFVTVGPMFLIDGITNGMRITLAYHFILVAFAYRNKYLFLTLALLSHVTAIFSLLSTYISNIVASFSKSKYVYFSILAVLLIYLYYNYTVILDGTRILSKIDYYSGRSLTTWFSGLADLAVLFFLILSPALVKPDLKNILVKFTLAIIFVVLFFYAIQFSLGSIRVLKLVLLGLFVSTLVRDNSSTFVYRIALVLGAAYSVNYLRQVMFTFGTLPYPGSL